MDSDKLSGWLEELIKGLVPHPDSVEVVKKTDEMGVLYTVRVHDEDWGLVIGKAGSTANAIRTILHQMGRVGDVRASVKFDAPERGYQD